tara:strand:- start:13397 stop:13609 length:213 start_codon:yes stop_codon:yes gene_type:complete
MKIYKITESYTGYIDYVVKANSEEEAMKLYNDDIDNCTEINNDSLYKDDFNFHSIEENKCPIIESLRETL